MKKLIIILILASLVTALPVMAEEAKKETSKLIIDGFEIKGADGKLVHQNSKWHFVFDRDVKGPKAGLIKAGKQITLLTSAALEKLIVDKQKNPASSYRLWGIVTKYESKNYIFCTYFLPFAKLAPAKKAKQMQINEPNDALTIPDDIVNKLNDRKVIRPEQLRRGLKLENDSVLIDRIGYIKTDEAGQSKFVFDALGRNAKNYSIDLLPCQVLEIAQTKSARAIEKTRFKITGIVTQFGGKNNMFLQKASVVYSYGNFSR